MLDHEFSSYGVREWRADEARFESARKGFDFERLSFTASSVHGGIRSATDVTSISNSDSGSFSSQLKLDPSQRHLLQSSLKVSNTRSSAEFKKRRSSFKMGHLAVGDISTVGRDKETMKLFELHDDPNVKMVNILGLSGSGKSVLAAQIYDKVSTSNGLLCMGKFDVQNRADPYKAFVEAIDQLIRHISKDNLHLARCQEALNETLGGDMMILLELVPSMKFLMPASAVSEHEEAISSKPGHSTSRSITERAARMQNVLGAFLRVVCTKDNPVTFILDDIQWAGQATLGLLASLLSDGNLDHFFMVATCRLEYFQELGDTENKDSGLQLVLDKHKDQIYEMKIEGLDVESVHSIINTLLRIDDVVRAQNLAKIVHQKTDGNPYFAISYMLTLVDEELLTFDVGKMMWEWFEVDVSSRNVADNVAQAVTRRLQKLDRQDLLVTQVAACISRTFDHATIQFVLLGLEMKLSSSWDIEWPEDLANCFARLKEKGIIEKTWGVERFEFSHDQVQQAAFELIPDDLKAPLRYAIGRRLIDGLDSAYRLEQYLFTAVELGGYGMDQMGEQEKRTFAFWAFLAGDTAIKQGAFEAASKLFDLSIACLGEGDPFDLDPQLALPLYSGAIEAAYCTTNTDKVTAYSVIVNQRQDIPPMDKIRVALVQIRVHSGNRELDTAIETFRKTVKSLGAGDFPRKANGLSVMYHLMKTTRMLKNFDRKKLLALPECTDKAMIAAASSYSTITTALFLRDPNLYVIAACMALQWSLKHGVTKYSSDSWVNMSIVILAGLGYTDMAIELSETALELCELHNYKERLPWAYLAVYGWIRHWKKPIHAFSAPMRYGIDIALRYGVLDVACNLINTYSVMCFLTATRTLPETINEVSAYRRIVARNHHDELGTFMDCSIQFAEILAEPQADNTTRDGNRMKESEMRKIATDAGDVVLSGWIDYYKTMLLVYFGDPVEASQASDGMKDFGITYAPSSHITSKCTFMTGIAHILAFNKTKLPKHLKAAKAMRKRMVKWISKGNPNVPHLHAHLAAEIAAAQNKTEKAEKFYREAICSSSRLGFKMDFAYANERCALAFKNSEDGKFFMSEAIRAYTAYGAMTNVYHLKQMHPDLLAA